MYVTLMYTYTYVRDMHVRGLVRGLARGLPMIAYVLGLFRPQGMCGCR
jgi:hypothetical protein